MKNYKIGYTVFIQVTQEDGKAPTSNFYDKGFIINLDTKEEKVIPATDAELILNTIRYYHNSETIRMFGVPEEQVEIKKEPQKESEHIVEEIKKPEYVSDGLITEEDIKGEE